MIKTTNITINGVLAIENGGMTSAEVFIWNYIADNIYADCGEMEIDKLADDFMRDGHLGLNTLEIKEVVWNCDPDDIPSYRVKNFWEVPFIAI